MFNFSLRKKLLLVSLLIFLVPWVGVRYIQVIEEYLQQSLLDNLSHYTQSVASGLAIESHLIPTFVSGDSVFALPLQKEPQLDGYDTDWVDYSSYRRGLQLANSRGVVATTKTPTMLIGLFENSLYLHIKIPDSEIIYLSRQANIASTNSKKTLRAEAIHLVLNTDGQQRKLIIQTEAPGTINARELVTGKWESRIKGVWRETDEGDGYQLELKIPKSYGSQGLNLTVTNVDSDHQEYYVLSRQLSIPVLNSPQQLTDRFDEFGLVPGRRIWLLDVEGRVLVKSGNLIINTTLSPVNPLFAWLLAPDQIIDPLQGKTRLEREDIQSALTGVSASRFYSGSSGENSILSSAWPVRHNGQIIAVLLIEESTATIQLMQRSALSELLNLSLLVFILLSVSLIGFAGRLTSRIKRLRDVTDQSIDHHGRVTGELPDSKNGDELDDLSTHISEMLQRLQQYHEYLENLASRLSHELRTPVAVVQSSLENMQMNELSEDNLEILNRADQGIRRLQKILNRMAEASRLEHSITDATLEDFELKSLLKNMVKGYEAVHHSQKFNLLVDDGHIFASKDLIAQCLDKLISNATSFANENTDINVDAQYIDAEKIHAQFVEQGDNQSKSRYPKRITKFWQLSVSNQGPSLPEKMEQQLFQSMVSVRDKMGKQDEPHLGLGLHIVRLIAEFHSGEVSARNLQDGVCITLLLPDNLTVN